MFVPARTHGQDKFVDSPTKSPSKQQQQQQQQQQLTEEEKVALWLPKGASPTARKEARLKENKKKRYQHFHETLQISLFVQVVVCCTSICFAAGGGRVRLHQRYKNLQNKDFFYFVGVLRTSRCPASAPPPLPQWPRHLPSPRLQNNIRRLTTPASPLLRGRRHRLRQRRWTTGRRPVRHSTKGGEVKYFSNCLVKYRLAGSVGRDRPRG